MRTLTADLFISLDGFATGTNEAAYFGYDGPDLSNWVQQNLARPQVLLMGRNTYVALAGFAAAATDPGSIRMRDVPKLVFSNTLKDPLDWVNSRVIAGDLEHAIRGLREQRGNPIRTFGSMQLVKGLMRLGLVDRLRLMVFPVILGDSGNEPAFFGYQRTGLELVATTMLDSRVLLLEYEPQRRTIETEVV